MYYLQLSLYFLITVPATIEEPSIVEVSTTSIALEWESVKG